MAHFRRPLPLRHASGPDLSPVAGFFRMSSNGDGARGGVRAVKLGAVPPSARETAVDKSGHQTGLP